LSNRPHSSLVLVPTPIGNLKDITLRALDTLKEVDLILAEDTRVTIKLLRHYEISTQCSSFHQNNEHYKTESILEKLKEGKRVAVCTDAGTPGISDPGFFLVRAAIEAGIDIETLPGATAFVPALVNSGLPCDRFVFEGFLPTKKGRQTRFEKLKLEERTMVFYESPYRIGKTLGQMAEYFGEDRRASVSREITKLFEEHQRGGLGFLRDYFNSKPAKGEFVIVVEGNVENKKQ
jgi:16S rRNA (cytidine1402-2'-O)-methyltransferase